MAGIVQRRTRMGIIEDLWWAAHDARGFPRWEVFQLAAVVAGATMVARARDAKLLRAYLVGTLLAAFGAVVMGSGEAWASFAARGWRGPIPELEIAGLGAIAGLVAGYVVAARAGYRRKKSARAALDVLAPAIAVMIAIARLGCFFAGCDFGSPTAVPWALRYPPMTPAFKAQVDAGLIRASDATTLAVHPTQLYESFAGVVVLGVALAWPRLRGARARDGSRFVATLGAYLGCRFVVDFVRGDLPYGALGLTTSQWLCVAAGALLAASASAVRMRARRARGSV